MTSSTNPQPHEPNMSLYSRVRNIHVHATNSDVLCHVVRAYVNHNTSCTYTTSYVHVATSTRGTNFLYSTAVRNYVYSCKDKF